MRDRALLLVGFALGLRRSELVAIRVRDISPSPDGVTIRIARSKTDQQGRGAPPSLFPTLKELSSGVLAARARSANR